MRLSSGKTRYVDEWQDPDRDVRIAVSYWKELAPVTDQYVDPCRSVRYLWYYLRRHGVENVWRKIRSRLAESRRNRKVVAMGLGTVRSASSGGSLEPGQDVLFFAPNHRPNPSLLCLHEAFARPFEASRGLWRRGTDSVEVPDALRKYIGWSPYSGIIPDRTDVAEGLDALEKYIPVALEETYENVHSIRLISERRERRNSTDYRKTAAIFGLGQHAKVQIIPHIRKRLDVACIHEIDPCQIRHADRWAATLDTAPFPREDERYDAWFVAGYHHMHAPLAVHALNTGAYAVVEKPLATTRRQFAALKAALGNQEYPKLFACFHMRYSRFTSWARKDLGAASGQPIDMHAVVYEVPIPPLHWYNWPNSGSRLISNGCHWIDYFLFMNHFVPVRDAYVRTSRGRDLVMHVELQNDAYLALSLTETGSARLGVRQMIELRASNRTIRMIDGERYAAESTARILRRRKVRPEHAYEAMYSRICERIAVDQPGDPPNSLLSTSLLLDLEEQIAPVRTLRA